MSMKRSGVAADDLSTKQFYCVSYQSTGKVNLTGDGARCDAILQDKPAADGRACELVIAGPTRAVAGGAFNPGTLLGCDSSGRVVDAASGDVVVGIAEEAATNAGDIVFIQKYLGYGTSPA